MDTHRVHTGMCTKECTWRHSPSCRAASGGGVIYQFVTKHPELSVDDLYAAAGATGSAKATGIIGEYAARLPVGKTEAQKLYREVLSEVPLSPLKEEINDRLAVLEGK